MWEIDVLQERISTVNSRLLSLFHKWAVGCMSERIL